MWLSGLNFLAGIDKIDSFSIYLLFYLLQDDIKKNQHFPIHLKAKKQLCYNIQTLQIDWNRFNWNLKSC